MRNCSSLAKTNSLLLASNKTGGKRLKFRSGELLIIFDLFGSLESNSELKNKVNLHRTAGVTSPQTTCDQTAMPLGFSGAGSVLSIECISKSCYTAFKLFEFQMRARWTQTLVGSRYLHKNELLQNAVTFPGQKRQTVEQRDPNSPRVYCFCSRRHCQAVCSDSSQFGALRRPARLESKTERDELISPIFD